MLVYFFIIVCGVGFSATCIVATTHGTGPVLLSIPWMGYWVDVRPVSQSFVRMPGDGLWFLLALGGLRQRHFTYYFFSYFIDHTSIILHFSMCEIRTENAEIGFIH